ncbi:MAG: SRPBCC domain-containing protein [Hyalangium sp.]|uniref:SRPBCC family protein n=1 Tax=Hyalangium sp. TaxID=2028555 RepID=UPI003899B75E
MSELTVDVWIPQALEQVFTAFVDPFQLRRWYGAPPGCHRTGADGDVAPGEPFRVELIDAKGVPFAQLGRILSVEPGEGLVLEMAWEGGNLGRDTTRAAISLRPVDNGTRLEVCQGPFSSQEPLEAHRAYWKANLGRLARVAAGEAVPCFEEFWEESLGFVEPLGVAAYAVLAGLREAGAPPEAIAQLEETLYAHLTRLPEETARVLGAVLHARLNMDPEIQK